MNSIFIDANIILDVLYKREPYFEDSNVILSLCENKKIHGITSTAILMNLHYIIMHRTHSRKIACKAIAELGKILDIIDIRKEDVLSSCDKVPKNIDNYVNELCAIRNSCEAIITRNRKDFSGEKIRVMDPEEFLKGY